MYCESIVNIHINFILVVNMIEVVDIIFNIINLKINICNCKIVDYKQFQEVIGSKSLNLAV